MSVSCTHDVTNATGKLLRGDRLYRRSLFSIHRQQVATTMGVEDEDEQRPGSSTSS